MGEKLQLYCETCEVLTCKDCQLSEKHSGHKHRENHEVVPDVKIALNQAVSDVRLKRNVLNEGLAHHMFSRFLNLRIYFNDIRGFFLFFYKEKFSIIIKNADLVICCQNCSDLL